MTLDTRVAGQAFERLRGTLVVWGQETTYFGYYDYSMREEKDWRYAWNTGYVSPPGRSRWSDSRAAAPVL